MELFLIFFIKKIAWITNDKKANINIFITMKRFIGVEFITIDI